MGSPKPLVPWGGRPALQQIAASFTGCPLKVLVVRDGAEWLTDELAAPFEVVRNPAPERGMLSSLQCGLAAARRLGAGPVLATPVDCPGVLPSTVQELLAAHTRHGRSVVPVWQGRPGHPVLLAATAQDAVLGADPWRTTLRDLLSDLVPTPLLLEVSDPAVLDNFNTPSELARARSAGGISWTPFPGT